MLKEFGDKIEAAVKSELADGQPAALLVTVLINMLARLIVGVHQKSGASLEALTDIVRNQIDEAVVHHGPHNPRTDRSPRQP